MIYKKVEEQMNGQNERDEKLTDKKWTDRAAQG